MTPAEKSLSGLAALQTSTRNAHSRFTSAAERLSQRAPVDVHFTPKFKLNRADGIFTMGSCFARNVEDSLIRGGAKVLLEDFNFPLEFFHPNHARLATWKDTERHGHLIRSVLNKYSPLSMLNEFERTLTPQKYAAPQKGLVHLGDDRWFDPQVNNTRISGLRDSLLVRYLVETATKKVLQASAIFLTLGFTETWQDSETGIVLNVPPPPLYIKRWPERFRFQNATYGDVLASLEELYRLVAAHIRPDMKFIVTVSPVPLGTTFTAKDIIQANAYSKATLRAAVEAFCDAHENVDYFPSYEMVMSTNPDIAWDDDKVHVTQTLVDAVIGRFMAGFFSDLDAVAQPAVPSQPETAPA